MVGIPPTNHGDVPSQSPGPPGRPAAGVSRAAQVKGHSEEPLPDAWYEAFESARLVAWGGHSWLLYLVL
jgi:hypothetical protein